MPSKKKTDLAAKLQDTPVEEVVKDQEVLVKASEVKATIPQCGHINRQHTGVDGELEDIACTLPKGHTGDHSAKVRVLQKQQYTQKNPKLEYVWRDGLEYEVHAVDTFWSDAAGVPVTEVKPDYEGHPNRKEWEQARKLARSTNQIV